MSEPTGARGCSLLPRVPEARETGATFFDGAEVAAVTVSPARVPSSGGSTGGRGGRTAVPRAARPRGACPELARVAPVGSSQAVGARCAEPNPTPTPSHGGSSRGRSARILSLVQPAACRSAALVNQCDRWRSSYRWGPAHIHASRVPARGRLPACEGAWLWLQAPPSALHPFAIFLVGNEVCLPSKGFLNPVNLWLQGWASGLGRVFAVHTHASSPRLGWVSTEGRRQVRSCLAHSTADTRGEEPLFSQGPMPSRSQVPVPGFSRDLRLGAV